MWYVLRVTIGQEEKMLHKIAKVLQDFEDTELFVPRYVRVRKYKGAWHSELAVLFPGYVFVDTEEKNVTNIQKALYIFTGLVEPVCIGGGFYPIKYTEQEFLQKVMNSTHEIGFSVGNIIDGELIVDEGPLSDFKQHVCKIDRHGRFAIVRMMLWGEEYKVRVGLEVREKR